MKLIFLGSPGVGKGTFAKEVINAKQIPQISTGVILREAVKLATSLGVQVKEYMESGQLVPDEFVVTLLSERISQKDCENGFILDGFPRTIPQAEALEKSNFSIDQVLFFNAKKEVIISRISNRRICEQCGETYHLINIPPKVEGVCDRCGGTLIQRDDDKPEAVEKRLVEYHQKTAPLIEFYQQRDLLTEINANGEKNETMAQVREVLAIKN